MAKSVHSEETSISEESQAKPQVESSDEIIADADAQASDAQASATLAVDYSLEGLAKMKGTRKRLISPMDVHFSQTHIRPEFQDGKGLVEDAITNMKKLSMEPILSEDGNAALAEVGAPINDSQWWLLQPDFPEIEVIEWRCKLRNPDGALKTDAAGNELHGDLEWYTLDNRRLYCLQKAAIANWPADVRCIVSVILQQEGNQREFRKFRTLDLGRTIGIGHRDDEKMERWSWRTAVGLPEEALPSGTAVVKAPRRRLPNGRNSGPRSGRNSDKNAEEDQNRWADLPANIALFVLLYAALRVFMHVVRWFLNSGAAGSGTAPLGDSLEGTPLASADSVIGSALGSSP